MKETWRVVYAGFRYEEGTSERNHVYYRIENDGEDRPVAGRRILMNKELLRASPGAVLSVEVEQHEDGGLGVYNSNRHYDSELRWADVDPDTVGTWSAMDRAHTHAMLAARNARKDDFDLRLTPIRTAYLQLAAPQRAALLVQVVKFITAAR